MLCSNRNTPTYIALEEIKRMRFGERAREDKEILWGRIREINMREEHGKQISVRGVERSKQAGGTVRDMINEKVQEVQAQEQSEEIIRSRYNGLQKTIQIRWLSRY